MHVDRQRRRTDDKRAHAGDQRRAALGRTDTRSPRGTAAMRRRDEREILRRGVRRDLPGSEREAAPGVGSALRNDGHYGRIGPAGRGAGALGPRGGHRLHPRHGIELLPVLQRRNPEKRPTAGLCAGRRGQRGRAGAQPGERHLQGAHSAERGVSRGARAELRGDHPPRLPRALRQPLSGLVRTFHTRAYRPPGDPGAGTPVVPRLCVPQPEPLSGGTPRLAAGRRGGPLRGVAARGAGSGGPWSTPKTTPKGPGATWRPTTPRPAMC